jgi:hypothetical protein
VVPKLASVLAAKAKVTGVVALALTAGGAGGALALSQVSSAPEQVVTASDSSPSPTGTPAAAPTHSPHAAHSARPTPSSTFVLPTCSPGENHGQYVSSVTHSAPKGKGGVHGFFVSRAAQSNCGQAPSGSGTAAPDGSSSEAPEAPDSPDGTDSGGSGGGGGGSNHGHGHGHSGH